ncbi:MAG: CRISPR-associated endonuclease Cas3'', partial [Planctomycetes bacterium]|nr:CRISPR-associated endonuclease Cas3'' [Planctomycetota bacterium]
MFFYWGKVSRGNAGRPDVHLLPLHCLDVAAVAHRWLSRDPCLAARLLGCRAEQAEQWKAWILFFTALHDLGKVDFRFQMKAPDVAERLCRLHVKDNCGGESGFDHGRWGYRWLIKERETYGLQGAPLPWMRAVASHHGRWVVDSGMCPVAEQEVLLHNRDARHDLVRELAALFLGSDDLSAVPLGPPPSLLAGFCSVCDWLGSNSDFFPFVDAPPESLADYYAVRLGEDYAGR